MANPIGRPTDYRPEYCEVAVKFLKSGKSRTQLASHLDVAKSVMQRWEKNNPDFQVAIELGLTHSEARWLDKGEENIDNKNFSVRMYELQMMNRFGWYRKIEGKALLTEVPLTEDEEVKMKEAKENCKKDF